MNTICQQAFNRKVSSSWLIALIALLLGLLHELVEPGQFFGVEMPGLHQTHHQTFRRAAEEMLDHVADGLADDLAATDSGPVAIGASFQSEFDVPLAVQAVSRGVTSGIG